MFHLDVLVFESFSDENKGFCVLSFASALHRRAALRTLIFSNCAAVELGCADTPCPLCVWRLSDPCVLFFLLLPCLTTLPQSLHNTTTTQQHGHMDLYVAFSNETRVIEVALDDTTAHMRQKVASAVGLPEDSFDMSFGDKTMGEGADMRQLSAGDTIVVTKCVKSQAAAPVRAVGAPLASPTWLTFIGHIFSEVLCGRGVNGAYQQYQARYGPYSQYAFDMVLKEVVTAPYTPHTRVPYIARKQDGDLQEALHSTFATEGVFFMLTGERNAGKTSAMQDLLRREYQDGVIEVCPYSCGLQRGHEGIKRMVEEAVRNELLQYNWYITHANAHTNFVDLMTHASQLRKQAKGNDAHPLIIYLDMDSCLGTRDHETMVDIAKGVSSVARDISSVPNGCKVIVEFPRTAVSDVLEDLPGEVRSFQVDAMTEDEFMTIGGELFPRWVDVVQNIADPYLHYYHDWLGGQTFWVRSFLRDRRSDYCMHRLCCLCRHHAYYNFLHTLHHS